MTTPVQNPFLIISEIVSGRTYELGFIVADESEIDINLFENGNALDVDDYFASPQTSRRLTINLGPKNPQGLYDRATITVMTPDTLMAIINRQTPELNSTTFSPGEDVATKLDKSLNRITRLIQESPLTILQRRLQANSDTQYRTGDEEFEKIGVTPLIIEEKRQGRVYLVWNFDKKRFEFDVLTGEAIITEEHIAPDSVGTLQLKNMAVTNEKIKDGTIEIGKLAQTLQDMITEGGVPDELVNRINTIANNAASNTSAINAQATSIRENMGAIDQQAMELLKIANVGGNIYDGDPTWTSATDRAKRAVWTLANLLKIAGEGGGGGGGADLSATFANLIEHVVHDEDLILADARENRLVENPNAETNNLIDADKDPLRKSGDPQIYSEVYNGNTYFIIPTRHVRAVSVYEIGDHTFNIPTDKDIMGLFLRDRDYGSAEGALIIGNGTVILMVRSNLDRGTLQFEDFNGDTEQERFRANFGVVDGAASGGFFFVTTFFDGITQDGFAAVDGGGKFTKTIRFVTHLNDANVPKLAIDLIRLQVVKSDDYGAYTAEQISEFVVNRQMEGINASPRSVATEARNNALKISTLSDGLARLLGMDFLTRAGLPGLINSLQGVTSADTNVSLLGVDVKEIDDGKGLVFAGVDQAISANGSGTPQDIPFKGSVLFGRPDLFYYTGLLATPGSGSHSISIRTTDNTPVTVDIDAFTISDNVLRTTRDSVDYSNSAIIIFDGTIFLMFTEREALPTTPPSITLNISWTDEAATPNTYTSSDSSTFSDFEEAIPEREIRINGNKGFGYRWDVPTPILQWQMLWKNRNQVFEGFRVAVQQFTEFPDSNFDPRVATPRDPFLASRQLWFDPRTGQQTLPPARMGEAGLEFARAVRDTDSQQIVGYTFGGSEDQTAITTDGKLEIVPRSSLTVPEGATAPGNDNIGTAGFLISFRYPQALRMFFNLGSAVVGRDDVALFRSALKVSKSTVLDLRKLSASGGEDGGGRRLHTNLGPAGQTASGVEAISLSNLTVGKWYTVDSLWGLVGTSFFIASIEFHNSNSTQADASLINAFPASNYQNGASARSKNNARFGANFSFRATTTELSVRIYYTASVTATRRHFRMYEEDFSPAALTVGGEPEKPYLEIPESTLTFVAQGRNQNPQQFSILGAGFTGLTIGEEYRIVLNLRVQNMSGNNEGILVHFRPSFDPASDFKTRPINPSTGDEVSNIFTSFIAKATQLHIYIEAKNRQTAGQVTVQEGGYVVQEPGILKKLSGNSF